MEVDDVLIARTEAYQGLACVVCESEEVISLFWISDFVGFDADIARCVQVNGWGEWRGIDQVPGA